MGGAEAPTGQVGQKCPLASPGISRERRSGGRRHLHQGVRQAGSAAAATDQPWASSSKITEHRRSPRSLTGPRSPWRMSQLGCFFFFFFKAGSHFLPTFLTSGNLSGSFPEPSGFRRGHGACLCSLRSQPGHWAPDTSSGAWRARPPTAEPGLPHRGSAGSGWLSASQI